MFAHTRCFYVRPSNRVHECTKTHIDPKPHLCFYGVNEAPDIQHFSQTIIIYCQINISMFSSIHWDIKSLQGLFWSQSVVVLKLLIGPE